MKPTVQSALFLSTKWTRPFFSPPRPTLLFICLLSPPNYLEILETYCLDILFIAERNCSLFESFNGKEWLLDALGQFIRWQWNMANGNPSLISLCMEIISNSSIQSIQAWPSMIIYVQVCVFSNVFHCQGGWLEENGPRLEDWVPGLRSRLCLWASDHLNPARQGVAVDWWPLHFWLNPPIFGYFWNVYIIFRST